jgi:hypothetical protein
MRKRRMLMTEGADTSGADREGADRDGADRLEMHAGIGLRREGTSWELMTLGALAAALAVLAGSFSQDARVLARRHHALAGRMAELALTTRRLGEELARVDREFVACVCRVAAEDAARRGK